MTMMSKSFISRFALVITVLTTLSVTLFGCNDLKIIDRARFQFSDNLEIAQFSLIFSNDIKGQFGGAFALKNYGDVFINPWTETAPFEVGFNLNWTTIVNEQDYVNVAPTLLLPNGEPTDLSPLVEVRPEQPVNRNFNVYGYVDVANTSWLGVAVILDAFTSEIFPADLSIRNVFMRDSAGNAIVFAKVFGPTATRPGGIAAFANVRYLAENRISRIDLAPGTGVSVEGKNAEYYRSHPEQLKKIQDDVIRLINSIR
jgi:hypothetical protein